MGMIAAATGLVVGGTAYQIDQQKKAERRSERANQRAEAARKARAARERRQLARQSILARSQAEMAGVATGAGGGSSNIQGAMGAATAQGAGNIGFVSGMDELAGQINSLNMQARKATTLAGYGKAAADLGMQIGMAAASAGAGGGSSSGGTTTAQGTAARSNYNISVGKGGY